MLSRSAKALGLAATFGFLFLMHLCFRPEFPYHRLGLVDSANESHNAGTQQLQIHPVIVTPSASILDDKKDHASSPLITTPEPVLGHETVHELVHEHEHEASISSTTSAEIQSHTPKPIEPQQPKPKLPSGFPKKIWQTGPKPVSQETRDRMETWMKHNPSFRHEFLSDEGGDAYVIDKYRHRPDILDLYLNLQVKILKADILRYLILLADGGIWSDIDVTCLGSVDDWIPAEFASKVSIVVGQEFDFPWQGEGTKLSCQFTNWVFMAKPGSKHLQMVVDDIVNELRDIARDKNVTYPELKKSHLSDVVDVTGPKKMTVSLLKSLALELNAPVDDRNVSSLKRPVLVGDLLVHPGAAFAASQSGNPKDQGPNLVTHHYAGSWKGDEH